MVNLAGRRVGGVLAIAYKYRHLLGPPVVYELIISKFISNAVHYHRSGGGEIVSACSKS